MVTCQIVLLTCQIVMLTSQIVMLTCQLIMLTGQIVSDCNADLHNRDAWLGPGHVLRQTTREDEVGLTVLGHYPLHLTRSSSPVGNNQF